MGSLSNYNLKKSKEKQNMSYCVQCGVKLEQSLKTCPLCHTPVINPNELIAGALPSGVSPFSTVKGEVEPMKKYDIGLWLTLVFGSTAIACGILNLFVFNHNYWSIPVIGACIVMWIFFCPRMFLPQIPITLNLAISAVSIIFYQLAITLMTEDDRWFFKIALPITLVLMGLVALSGICYKFVAKSLMATVLYFFIDVGILSVVIEYFIDTFLGGSFHIFWSAIVFSVCSVISIALIAILSMKRLRATVQKRLHF